MNLRRNFIFLHNKCNEILFFIIQLLLTIVITNGQESPEWEKTNFPDTIRINSLVAVDNFILAGTNGNGIYFSEDSGNEWIKINDQVGDESVYNFYLKDNRIYAGVESGISLSTDNGSTWNKLTEGLDGKSVWSFAEYSLIPGQSTLFAGTWSGIYKSTNEGVTWEPTSLSKTSMPVHTILANETDIYAATFADGFYHSQSGGFGWEDNSFLYIEEYTKKTSILPVYSLFMKNNNFIAGVGSSLYYKSQTDTSFSANVIYPVRNSPFLCFAERNDVVFCANSRGNIIFSENNGINWSRLSPSLLNTSIYSLALDKNYIYAGTDSCIWRLYYPEEGSNNITGNISSQSVPYNFSLEQNYPNPFNPVTTIKYQIVNEGARCFVPVQLKIYNLLGQEIVTLVDSEQPPGNYLVKFDGSKLSSGIYLCVLKADHLYDSKKLILIK